MEWGKWCPGASNATPAPAPSSVVTGQPYGTGVLLPLPIAELPLCVPTSGLLLWGAPTAPVLNGCVPLGIHLTTGTVTAVSG